MGLQDQHAGALEWDDFLIVGNAEYHDRGNAAHGEVQKYELFQRGTT